MKNIIYRILIATIPTISCPAKISSEAQGADAPESLPAAARSQLIQFQGPPAQEFELPEGIEEILNPTWPPMPLKKRIDSSAPVIGGAVVQGFQLIAQPEKHEFEVLEPIEFRITLRNTTDKELKLTSVGMDEKDFVAEVRGAGGIMPLTVYGKALDPTSSRLPNSILYMGAEPLKLKAHQEWSCSLLINQVTDMTLSGSYFITIKSPYLKNLVSNVVRVDVFPRHTLPPARDAASQTTKAK